MKCSKKLSSFILCIALIVAMAFLTTGCNGSTGGSTPNSMADSPSSSTADSPLSGAEAQGQTDVSELGEGSTKFTFTVVDKEGSETQFLIHTDKETVGQALTELGLIDGEEGEYGLFVKTVNGITADYDKDGVYWAFYVNGEYAQTSVDSTIVTEGDSYSFQVE